MDQAATTVRALPGVSFSAPASPHATRLPRMDVSAFVGYAASGPVDIPVHVSSPRDFENIFGKDVQLAGDPDPRINLVPGAEARLDRAVLGPCVRAFFDNGGRSCWVVRVGRAAVTSAFPVAGLIGRTMDPQGEPLFRPLLLDGRSPGSFLDDIQAIARLRRRPIPILTPGAAVVGGPGEGSLPVPGTVAAQPGDLLELVFDDEHTVWVPIRSRSNDGAGGAKLIWLAQDETWLQLAREVAPRHDIEGWVIGPGQDAPRPLQLKQLRTDQDGYSELLLNDSDAEPVPGDLVIVEYPGHSLLVTTICEARHGPPTQENGRSVAGWPTWRMALPGQRPALGNLRFAAVLELDLATRRKHARGAAIKSLAFSQQHPRWIGHLPSDRDLFRDRYREAATQTPTSARNPGLLDVEVDSPRFPLAASAAMPELCLPLGIGPSYANAAEGLRPPGSRRERDGLTGLGWESFVDPSLVEHEPQVLLAQARRRFLVEGRDLLGLHALIPLADIAVVAVPDALHGHLRKDDDAPPPVVGAPELRQQAGRLDWDDPFARADQAWEADEFVLERSPAPDMGTEVETTRIPAGTPNHDIDQDRCHPGFHRIRALRGGVTSPWSTTVRVPPRSGVFDGCDREDLQAPATELDDGVLSWAPGPGRFEIQQSPHPLFEGDQPGSATVMVSGQRGERRLQPPQDGLTYVRVRSLMPAGAGPWSVTLAFRSPKRDRWEIIEPVGELSEVALKVHDELARLTRARGDLTALLSFPCWYDAELIERHVARLGDGLDALHPHHPWTLTMDPDSGGMVATPADGAAAGRMAQGSLSRGPWAAVAGSALSGALGVTCSAGPIDPQRLRNSQVNGLLQTRRGVSITGVDTLSRDPRQRAVTVRRLMILIRRLALREGRRFVFEPAGPQLRSLITTRFESVLGLIHRMGGLAGNDPSGAYRVLCDEGLNPPRALDQGRVVVELQVAPAHPLEYISVRLLRRSDGGFELSEVQR